MELIKKISWEQGLFLQPQHFQLVEAHYDLQQSYYTKLTHANCWGSEKVVIDKAALEDQQVNIQSGVVLFKSGTLINIGQNAIVIPRAFIKSWQNRSQALDVYLGIKRMSQYGSNVTTINSWDEISSVQSRYVALEQPELVKDYYYDGPDAYVKQQLYVLQLIWGDEVEEACDFELVQIAKVIQRGDTIALDRQYIPPCLALKSYHRLNNIVKDLRDDLYARAKQLDIYKLPTAEEDNQRLTRLWFNLLALQVFNRYIPVISHLLVIDPVSPSDCFMILLQLIGELKTFHQNEQGVLTAENEFSYFIEYRHDQLNEVFDQAKQLIFKLCDNITFVPHHFFALDYVNDLYSADLPNTIFTPRTSYYLRVHAEENMQRLKSIDLLDELKVGSIISIETIVQRSLSGIPLEVLDSAPAGVPKDSICIYLRLDPTVESWRSVVSSQSISVFWAEPIDGVKIDFVAVRS
ncbi:type VI secretion system baseplate subunit TssK [Thiotrichales bacterium 19S3-7]|nr:type VI secretion system baseplate subunit TssK [Thiotrichales bacterium 19S3-7]MCF6802139.1 type VI secretion system baseplate subunit TssK [Thiotrichales bacterium 19S3-11]